MSAPPWMPFYVADYLADTGHLSTLEHGAYMLLIMHYWQHKGLPPDELKLARISRLSEEEWSAVRGTMVALFDEGWTHKRIDAEIAKTAETMIKRSAAGKAGASARHGNRTADASTNVKQTAAQKGGGEGTTSPQDSTVQEEASPRAAPAIVSDKTAELDSLERELRAAAGLDNDPSPSLLDLSPIVTLIDKGYSLSGDILPKLREAKARAKKGRSWAYYVQAIVERKEANGAIPANPKTQGESVAWVEQTDARFGELQSRFVTERGKPCAPHRSRMEAEPGFHFPTVWVAA